MAHARSIEEGEMLGECRALKKEPRAGPPAKSFALGKCFFRELRLGGEGSQETKGEGCKAL